jgi:2-polyprenyl-6-methoxyphenol hydroxylase-like FAD-dependent oxidoreductase
VSSATPVLIVGAGPVGLALAGDLGWRGIPALVVERGDGSIYQPRQDLVGVRTMEFCRRWGIARWVEESPYPRDYPQDCVYATSLNGYELGRERLPSMDGGQPPPQSPQRRERCPQDMFDPILARHARSFPHVSLRYGTELVDLEESSEGVTATVRDTDTGAPTTIHADYVVGCDGGSSKVRSLLGIGMSGRPALTYTTNVIFRCEDLVALHDKGEAYRFIFIGPEGTWATLVAINGADRWRMSIIGGDEEHALSEQDIDAAIRRAVGRDFAYEVLSVVPWVRHELVADSYGGSRVFIAGDAAHLMSPTGGFGMNTGVGDAVDLSWKLAAVLGGWGGASLLESYELERRPVAIRNVTEASGNLRRMLSPRDEPLDAVFEPGPEGELARKEFGERYSDVMRREWFCLGIHLGYRYDDSPICWSDGTPAPPDEVMNYEQTARPGARAPHVWIGESRSTLDLYGHGFTLLRLGDDAPTATGIADAAGARGIPLSVVALPDREVLEAYERRLVLVRPDGHVAWRSDEEPDVPGALLELATGHAGSLPA